MKLKAFLGTAVISTWTILHVSAQAPSLKAILNYSKISNLSASENGHTLGWISSYKAEKNVFIAQSPSYEPQQKTFFNEKDELEISGLQFSADNRYAVFVRGGDHGGFLYKTPNNAMSLPEVPSITIWRIALQPNAQPELLTDGDYPALSPDSKTIAYLKNGEIWSIPLAGGKAQKIVQDIGKCSGLQWSPDGKQLAFVSGRKGHSLIGIYRDSSTPIQWVAPSFFRDNSPRWSDDGKRLAFIRTISTRLSSDSILVRRPDIWQIWVTDLTTQKNKQVYQSPYTLPGGMEPTTSGGFNLNWMAGNQLSFLSYQDGWPHLYALPATGGKEICLTPGEFMVEYPKIATDRKRIYFCANLGKTPEDRDRRHLFSVDLSGKMQTLTEGTGVEAYPLPLEDRVACIASSATGAPVPALVDSKRNTRPLLQQPNEAIAKELITPSQVVFRSPDGFSVHAQLFLPKQHTGKIPAVVFVHGGPDRQMYLGWHYSTYYSNCYAVNEYLAAHGIAVLSVNYRCGIGYGFDFDEPDSVGNLGFQEYTDVKAAAEWLGKQSFIDAKHIGIYGGSYGGWMTSMALGKNSDLFAAGVDIHGVHIPEEDEEAIRHSEAPDARQAWEQVKKSFAIYFVRDWHSPVLLIHGDDDRNVSFQNSIDLSKALLQNGVPFESLAVPNDTHHWMKYANEERVNEATVEFLERKLQ